MTITYGRLAVADDDDVTDVSTVGGTGRRWRWKGAIR